MRLADVSTVAVLDWHRGCSEGLSSGIGGPQRLVGRDWWEPNTFKYPPKIMAVVGAAEEGFMGLGCYRVPVCLRQLGGLLGRDGTGLREEATHQGGHVCMCGHVWVPDCVTGLCAGWCGRLAPVSHAAHWIPSPGGLESRHFPEGMKPLFCHWPKFPHSRWWGNGAD